MKKNYQQPSAHIIAMHLDTLIAQSPTVGYGSGSVDAKYSLSGKQNFSDQIWADMDEEYMDEE
ncbi:MAG: hypothetical protein SPE09_05900 [Alloprevotella sp.]|nr:hypothetical protein [Alloprevotella sp.]